MNGEGVINVKFNKGRNKIFKSIGEAVEMGKRQKPLGENMIFQKEKTLDKSKVVSFYNLERNK